MTRARRPNQRAYGAVFALMAGGAAVGAAAACSSSGGGSPGTTGSSSGSTGYNPGTSQAPTSSGSGVSTGGGTSSTSGASSIGASTSGSGSASTTSAASCVTANSPTLINFENYNAMSDAGFNTYFGSGSSVGYIGPYAYSGGGPGGGVNWTLSPVTGRTGGPIDGGQDWALDMKLTQESAYGGGLGFWMSCVNASTYKGITFWARGQTPAGTCSADAGGGSCFAVQLSTAATTVVGDGGAGTCAGTSTTCVSPQATNLPLSITWTQYQIPWANFSGGMATGAAYTPDGNGLAGLTFVVSLTWTASDAGTAPDGATTYVPVPATIDFQVDDIGLMP